MRHIVPQDDSTIFRSSASVNYEKLLPHASMRGVGCGSGDDLA
jgi:hypothetical protein